MYSKYFNWTHVSLLFSVVHIILGCINGCVSDLDCQLNGICEKNKCICDRAWTGQDCGFLDLLPAPNHVSFHGPNENSTSWGGSVLSVPSSWIRSEIGCKTKVLQENEMTYVMYVAEMVNGCGLRDWKTNSAVAVATSPIPEGPYKRSHQIIPTWAHNPQGIHVVENDENGNSRNIWVVFTLGDGDRQPVNGPVKDCEVLNTPKSKYTPYLKHEIISLPKSSGRMTYASPNSSGNTTVYFTLHYSKDTPLGPFQSITAKIVDFPVEYDFPGNWNPAPVVLPDGRVRVMVHTNYPLQWTGGVIVEAANWRGPYHPITKDVTFCTKCQEDPFLWIDHRGHWHALYHKMFDPIKIDSEEYYLYDNYDGHHDKNHSNPIPSPGWAGGHAYSIDGLNWSNITRCYNTSVRFEDGTTKELLRRERPKLIFDPKDGVTPTHLVNGVLEEEHGTFTLVTPLRI